MPIYIYWCTDCKDSTERNVKVDERQDQYCDCGNHLIREFKFSGSVWAPTAGGMR